MYSRVGRCSYGIRRRDAIDDQQEITGGAQRSPIGAARPARDLGGLGFGLWIIRHIVGAHGGAIDARGEGPGRGSTFIVTLPASEVR